MPIINQVVSGGGTTPTGKYQLLQIVKDDSDNTVGVVSGFHTDGDGVEYAVVCLPQYQQNGNFLSSATTITDLAQIIDNEIFECTDTATSNCTKILDFATANNYTSSAVSHCRSLSFVIDGVTYYGQLPNIQELIDIFIHRTDISTISGATIQVVNSSFWSSTQRINGNVWQIYRYGGVQANSMTYSDIALPVLEIPNAV